MRSKELIIVGSGNPDIIDLINDINSRLRDPYIIIGFTDTDESLVDKKKFGFPVLGNDSVLTLDKYKNCSLVNNVFDSSFAHERVGNMIRKIRNINLIQTLFTHLLKVDFKRWVMEILFINQ